MRVGIGFDVHPFDPGRPLVLGGVTVPDAPGLAGHSDADVLCHAVADAMLGAVALGDIGSHFPDDDPAYAGASSIDLLAQVVELVGDEGYRLSSLDATVILERPRIADLVPSMRERLADVLGVGPRLVSVKATRTEGLGALGRGDGAACMAIVLLVPGPATGR